VLTVDPLEGECKGLTRWIGGVQKKRSRDPSHTVALPIIGQQIQGLRRGSNHRAAPLMKGLLLKTNNSTH
jgi:hypothetical protein